MEKFTLRWISLKFFCSLNCRRVRSFSMLHQFYYFFASDISLQELVQRILPICSHYSLVCRFIEGTVLGFKTFLCHEKANHAGRIWSAGRSFPVPDLSKLLCEVLINCLFITILDKSSFLSGLVNHAVSAAMRTIMKVVTLAYWKPFNFVSINIKDCVRKPKFEVY